MDDATRKAPRQILAKRPCQPDTLEVTMAAELRNTGISVVGDVPWGTHFCYFYETTQDLLDTLVPYFMAGLKSKEFCRWLISNSELPTVAEPKDALGQALPDLQRYLAERSIQIVTHDKWCQR